METVIIVIHLMVIVALVAVVLLQRSEGGALGIGGGGNFLTSRGSGNVLTRATGILAAAFFATSIGMTVLGRLAAPPSAILDTVPSASAPAVPATDSTAGTTAPVTGGTGGILNQLNAFTGQPPASGSTTTVPPADGAATGAPAAPAEPQVPTSQ